MTDLFTALRAETRQPLPDAVARMSEIALDRFGDAVQAVVFYGSCRRRDDPDGLYDLYVILRDYAALPRAEAWLARLLPPNVYYLEYGEGAERRRAKCTAISLRAFQRGTSNLWFHSYLWGRFCQPVSIAYSHDEAAEQQVLGCLATAVETFLGRVIPLVPGQATTADLWITGLRASYGAELRNEGPDRAAELFRSHAEHFEAVTRAANVPALARQADGRWRVSLGTTRQRLGRVAWAMRSAQGKLLSLARIFKAWYTFHGGLDYIVWKLARHTDREITIPDRVREKPWLYLWGFFWRLYREGVFR